MTIPHSLKTTDDHQLIQSIFRSEDEITVLEYFENMNPTKKIKLDKPEQNNRLCPILPDELIEETPLIEVYIDEIGDVKNTSMVIINLNSVLPVPELTHLKRVKGKDILLFHTNICEQDKVHEYLKSKGFDSSLLRNKIRKTFVAKIPPKVKKQHSVVNQFWPCNFHCNKYLEKLSTNTVFSEEEIAIHENYMRLAIDIARLKNSNTNPGKRKNTNNGAVIVDPKINSVVAVGYDCTEIGPCRHSVMVAIDNVARTQNGGAWNKIDNLALNECEKFNLAGISANVMKLIKEEHPKLNLGASWFKGKDDLEEPQDGPYLCTGYYVYSVIEPCIMCAMALIHSRAKRVFYSLPSKKGGLGTVCKVHTVKDLNHHYEVYSELLKNECIQIFNSDFT